MRCEHKGNLPIYKNVRYKCYNTHRLSRPYSNRDVCCLHITLHNLTLQEGLIVLTWQESNQDKISQLSLSLSWYLQAHMREWTLNMWGKGTMNLIRRFGLVGFVRFLKPLRSRNGTFMATWPIISFKYTKTFYSCGLRKLELTLVFNQC